MFCSCSVAHILFMFCSFFQILYCVDSSDPMMIGAATISLIQLLHHPALQVSNSMMMTVVNMVMVVVVIMVVEW